MFLYFNGAALQGSWKSEKKQKSNDQSNNKLVMKLTQHQSYSLSPRSAGHVSAIIEKFMVIMGVTLVRAHIVVINILNW